MQADGWTLLLLIAVIAFATFWVFAAAYGLYALGRRLAHARLGQRHTQLASFLVCLGASLLAAPTVLLWDDLITQMCAVAGTWLFFAQPVLVGLWAGLEAKRKADAQRFTERTDEWLAEWEDPVGAWLDRELE